MKHTHAGRPTKYDESMLAKIEEYLTTTGREAQEIPTLEGFAKYIDVNKDTIQSWCKAHPEFDKSVDKILSYQKIQLMNDGLYGGKEVNPTMAIFLLKVNHGMIEKSGLDITTGGEPFLFTRGNK